MFKTSSTTVDCEKVFILLKHASDRVDELSSVLYCKG